VKMNLRAKVLIGVAVAVLAYIVLVADDTQTIEPARVMTAPKRHEISHGTDHQARNLSAALKTSDRLVKDTVAGAMFAVQSWYVAPPAAPPARVVVQAPPPPSAPPLPFVFMGSYAAQDGKPTFFLTAGDRVYDVKVGDTLDNTYSVDGVKSGQLLLTYMPLKIQQSLVVGTE
jgi:hypothetical protein